MIAKNRAQLKAWIKNMSAKVDVNENIILQNYMLERLLERIAVSEYKYKFILKGGMLITAIVGIDMRNTLDMDATIKGFDLEKDNLENILDEIFKIDLDDGVTFEFKGIKEIRQEDEYGGYRVSLDAKFDKLDVPMKLDITTGDVITPKEIKYKFDLMFEDRFIEILAYNMETVIADKFETIISRNVDTTRARDFYDITKGTWSTSDLLLLKTAMATIGIQPKSKVNYFGVLREIENNTALKDKLLNGMEIRPITEPGYLIAMSTLKKMDSLQNEESYMVDTLGNYMKHYGVEIDHEQIYDDLTNQYLKEKALVNIDIYVESYDMILDLLYNLNQAEDEYLLLLSGQDSRIHEAEQAYLQCRFQEAFDMFKLLAENGNGRAMYFMGIFYRNGYGNVVEIDTEKGNMWAKKGMEAGDPLCAWRVAYTLPIDSEERKDVFN